MAPAQWRGETLRDLLGRAGFGLSVVGIHDTAPDEVRDRSIPAPDCPSAGLPEP